jgi:hypothetical protein
VSRLARARARRRGADREREAARLLGTKRTCRSRYERAPDCTPVRLPSGDVLCPEVKTGRTRLPAVVRKALAQARGYLPDAIPVAVISTTGGESIACLPLRDLARLLGLQPKTTAQLVLAPREATR